jgi:DNA repair protein RecO (recombination protein O)
VEEQPEPELLQLGLNSLYALSRGLGSQEKIKAAFELRLMCLTGYTPELTACAVCGKEPEEPVLSLEQGRVCCRSCAHQMGERAELGSNALEAMRYICAAPPKQMLRFELGEDAVLRLSDASERYLLRRAERGFSALDYWKKIRSF